MPMSFMYWQYFIALEDSLAATERYVEVHPDNFAAYSVEYARILLSASSEVDVLLKQLCDVASPNVKVENINDYRRIVTQKYPKFYTIEVLVPRYGLARQPWAAWGTGDNPDWWRWYNKVKHERESHYRQANLQNALDAMAGLFAVVLYLRRASGDTETPYPRPKLLDLKVSPGYLIVRSNYGLPDYT